MNPERRPLVIVGIGGGLEQWRIVKPGTGLPRTFVLDYDREGQYGDELLAFAEEIEEARAALAEYEDPKDDGALARMVESISEYEQMVRDDETAGRYR